ncbi:MAG: TrkA C-terminal domain-containing protein [Xanthomonadales bacterium]|nr:TrkA C-terminal domain-containing protein [Xanthomonadales bacterium]
MAALVSLLSVIVFSILITRIATVALVQTGLSLDAARFQARSAFTGAGFTTREAESVVNHPVRRRITMLLMLVGNAGIVAAISSLILTFVESGEGDLPRWSKTIMLMAGLLGLAWFAHSRWVDRFLRRAIGRLLEGFTELEVRDYAQLLSLGEDYEVAKLTVGEDHWLAGLEVSGTRLREEGISLLGIHRPGKDFLGVPRETVTIQPGDVVVLYGHTDALERLSDRREGLLGEKEHREAVDRHESEQEAEHEDFGDDGEGDDE